MSKHKEIVEFIKKQYGDKEFIPLHAPVFKGKEKEYLAECIDSTYVSYVGDFVNRFENSIAEYIGAKYAVATANGTLALHAALLVVGVKSGEEVITQDLTFVATLNAISYCSARPILVDSDKTTMGMEPEILDEFLYKNTELKKDGCHNKRTGKKISACVPVHIFGNPSKIDEIITICDKYAIPVVEDAAESLGSYYKGKHTGTFGKIGILSFNGNKIVTTGGGGMIVTDDEQLAKQAKHITTTAKVPHAWEFIHDEIGYNYRMPNINAAIGCAQIEQLPNFLSNKRELANIYKNYFQNINVEYFVEPAQAFSNYWLNTIILRDRLERDEFLNYSNAHGVMTRPAWRLMHKLKMFGTCQTTVLDNAQWLEDRIVNIPSGVRAV